MGEDSKRRDPYRTWKETGMYVEGRKLNFPGMSWKGNKNDGFQLIFHLSRAEEGENGELEVN